MSPIQSALGVPERVVDTDPDPLAALMAGIKRLLGRGDEAARGKTAIAYRPGANQPGYGRIPIDNMVASPLVQDTIASILATMRPERAVQTIRSTYKRDDAVGDSFVVGEYDNDGTRAIDLTTLIPWEEADLRQTLLHETGHAVGEGRGSSEPFADLFMHLVGVLGEPGAADSPGDLARKAVDATNTYRAGRTTGFNSYDKPLGDEWLPRAEALAKLVLGSDIYSTHPARTGR